LLGIFSAQLRFVILAANIQLGNSVPIIRSKLDGNPLSRSRNKKSGSRRFSCFQYSALDSEFLP
jgi:hypothetical protein